MRCWRCRQVVPLCICSLLPRLEHPTKLCLVLHRGEAGKPTNTGHLARRSLVGASQHIYGEAEPWQKGLDFAGKQVAVLYPSDDAVVLGEASAPDILIVPDGTWAQTTRMVKRDELLASLPRVRLPSVEKVGHRLRRNPRPDGLMTLEAIGVAYGAMGSPKIEEALRGLFTVLAERTMFLRGLLPANQVAGGVPDGALRSEAYSSKWVGEVVLRPRARPRVTG